MYPSGMSRIRPLLTEEELEVADLLFELPELILHFKQRQRACFLPEYLRWGVRKSRTLPRDEQSHHRPSRQRSPPSRPQPPPESCHATAAATTSSPSTPMSFPVSGGEDDSNNNDAVVVVAAAAAAPVRLRAPAFKNSKERNEWMEEQCKSIDSLTDSNSNLHREIEEYRALLQSLTAEYYQQLQLRESMTPAADSVNAVSSSQCRATKVEPPKRDLLDLNKLPAEATEEPSSALAVPPPPPQQQQQLAAAEWQQQKQQQQHEREAMCAEARRRAKRRLAMQRERSSPSGLRASDPLIVKKQRMR